MMSRKSAWRGALALMALATVASAMGQAAGDFPNLKGFNNRVGHNGNPNGTGPGLTIGHWSDPTITYNNLTKKRTPTTIQVDNTDTANTQTDFPGQGPFDPTENGSFVSSPFYTPLVASSPDTKWAWPNIEDEAAFPLLLRIRNFAIPLPPDPTVFPPNSDYRYPAYLYTRSTASDNSGDPRVGRAPAEVRTITYTLNGQPGVQRNYAVYAWIPIGPTRIGANWVFPQRYFVFEVQYGDPALNIKYTETVDTYASGGGWVRLGNEGAPTTRVFPCDGINPITVTQYNTVPRNSRGEFTMPMLDISGPSGVPDGVISEQYDVNSLRRFLTYADAVKAVPAEGYYEATPISARLDPALASTQLLFDARNTLTVSNSPSDQRTVTKGVVSARQYDVTTKKWITRWRYSPAEELIDTNTIMDNTDANRAGTFASDATVKVYQGADAYTSAIQAASTGAVTYSPTLNDGTYEIYVYLPGDNNGVQFGTAVQYQVICEGTTYTFAVNQSLPRGWVKIGNRRFLHDTSGTGPGPIQVVVTNQSAVAGDLTKMAYTDSVRFVGEKNQAISSTPIYATAQIRKAGGAVEETKVVVVADEDGRLHCLDAAGNGDGTTTEYWAYPSAKDPDPNDVAGEDGVGGVAEMPLGFELSTGLVQRVAGDDYLYIGSRNGRVYCINMTGRGDYTTTQAGTTTRRWTYPSTYPDPDAITESPLGSFRGSILYGVSSGGATIYVPTAQGRMYALDPRGNANLKKTTVKWTYPEIDAPTLGPIWMSPSYFRSVANDASTAKIIFGTLRKNDDPGKLYVLDAGSGVPIRAPFDPGGQSDFLASPAVVTYKVLANNNAAANGGVIYTVNQNRITYAIDVDTGAIIWQTGELGAGSRGAVTFQRMTVQNNVGVFEPAAAIMIPTLDGRFYGMYAENRVNRFGTKRIFEHVAEGDSVTASISNATGWMFGADSLGFLYAWTNTAGDTSGNEFFPGQETIVENNTLGDVFRKAKLKLVTKEAYQRLRYPTGDAQQLTRAQALSAAFSFNRTPLAFEWGETVYIMVYDFPFRTQSPNGNPVPPPIVNVSFNVEGKTVRGVAVEARKYNPASLEPKLMEIQPDLGLPPPPEGDYRVDGYAILAFPFQGGGANALPPGDAEITFTISTQSLNNKGAQQNVALRPDLSRQLMKMANPIAISMIQNPTVTHDLALGYNVNPSGPERLYNGNPAGAPKDRIATTTGFAQHGQSKATTMYVYDTSMMALLRPDGMGLEGVRMTRQDLERQGGANSVYKRLNPALYPGFEDLPDSFPNTSIDYPDIARENIRVTKDPSGEAENPLFNGVQLKAPLIRDGANPPRQMQEGDRPEDRVFIPTPIQIEVDVPLYQPPVDTSVAGFPAQTNSDGNGYIQGYMGRMSVFVDSFQNGLLDVAQREAYRSFNLATAVAPDEKLAVTTPSIDLGSLPTGFGFSALTSPGTAFNPAAANINPRVFHPWGGNYSTFFKEINVENRGNVNMLNLRVAKADATSGAFRPWFFAATTSDPLAWLEGGWVTNSTNLYNGNIWSDLDWQFSPWPEGTNVDRNVILQKPRVADRIPTALTVNPRRRANANIGARETPLFNANRFPTRNPRVAVTVPIGTPSGRYGQRMRIIENTIAPSRDILPAWNRISAADPSRVETFSDPTFDILFNVRETRLTNAPTTGSDTMIDPNLMIDPSDPTKASTYSLTSAYSNQMPAAVRDAFGSMVVAWSSNRPNWIIDPTVPAVTSNPFKLYIASLDSGWTFTNSGMTGPNDQNPTSPLRDLLNWVPSNGQRWWRREIANYPPQQPDQLFGSQTGESIIPSTVQYLNPAFPQAGMRGAFDPSSLYQGMYMAFVGEAQKSTPTGRISESRIMMSILSPSANGGINITAPGVLPGDPQMAKGKPTLIQTSTGAMVFFAGTAGGQSRIYYCRLQGSNFGNVSSLPFGNGFDSVSNPSATGRQYVGGAPADNGNSIVDLTFAGRLRGRPYNEVFLGRLKAVNAGGGSGSNADRLLEVNGNVDPTNAFVWLPIQRDERLAAETSGTYRSRGVFWNVNRRVYLIQTLNGQTLNVLNDGWSDPNNTPFNANDDVYNAAQDTRTYDATSGLLSYNTRLGGKAYLDPSLGSVRFSDSLPPRGAELLFSYQPRFLRVTPAGSVGYAGPTGLFDGRLVSDLSYWRTISGGNAGVGDAITTDRYFFTYNRAAAGAGQAARPYLTTMRLGVRLPYRIATNAAGAPVNVQVNGNTGPYQLDPAQGRIYFTAADEDRIVNITYTGVNEAGVPVPGINLQGMNVSLVGERAEEPILIEQAVNESGLTPFLDPYTYMNDRRPPLAWLFWTSTRSGSPDIYFETIAPQWAPVPVGR